MKTVMLRTALAHYGRSVMVYNGGEVNRVAWYANFKINYQGNTYLKNIESSAVRLVSRGVK